MTKVTLPPGCYGVDTADGSRYTAGPGGHIDVSDRHAAAIGKSQLGQAGLLSGSPAYQLGTKGGKRCPRCRFLAQRWADVCPRCGTATEVE